MNTPTVSRLRATAAKSWPWIAVPVALICGVIWLSSVREKYFVESMYGPYQGLDYAGTLPATTYSELKLKSGERLSVFALPESLAPALVLWSAEGDRRWSRLMVPVQRYSDGSVKEAWLRELRLHACRHSGEGYVVDITCNWELGGKESGRIYLGNDYSFENFKLSW